MNSKTISHLIKRMSTAEEQFEIAEFETILLDFLKGFSYYAASNEGYRYNNSYLDKKIGPFLNSLKILKSRKELYDKIEDHLIKTYVPRSFHSICWVLLLDDFFYVSTLNNSVSYVFDEGNMLFDSLSMGPIAQKEFCFSSFRNDTSKIVLLAKFDEDDALTAKREWQVNINDLTRERMNAK